MTHPGWAVAIVEPGRDHVVHRGLMRSGFRVVFLAYRKLLTGHNRPGWRRSGDFVDRPLFPGYLFVELWPDQPFPQSERVPGYAGLIEGGRRTLADNLVMSWRDRVNAGEFDDKRPEPKAAKASKFIAANDPEERRKLLEARFAEMIAAQYAVRA